MFLIHLQEQLDASKTYLSAAVKNIALIREVKLSVLLRLHSISILCRQSPSKWYKRLWLSARKHLWCCDPLVTKSSQWTKKLHWNCLTSPTWIPRHSTSFVIIWRQVQQVRTKAAFYFPQNTRSYYSISLNGCLKGKSIVSEWGGSNCFLSFLSALRPLKGFLSWHGALQGPSPRFVCCFQN